MENRITHTNDTAQIVQNNFTENAPKKPFIKTPRQARFIQAVLFSTVSTHTLREMVGSENIWNECAILREQGWKIQTTRIPAFDRDRKKVSIGHYRLDYHQRPHALQELEFFYAESK